MRLLREALEGFGLVRAGALGRDGFGLGGGGRSRQARPGPSEVQHDEEPHDCQERELVVKKG